MSETTLDKRFTMILCGDCKHRWDGPVVPIQGTTALLPGASVTCSKCGARAIDVDMWEMP